MRKRTLADRLTNSWLGHLFKRAVSSLEFAVLLHYKKKTGAAAMAFLREIWKEEAGTMLFSPHELFMIYSIARGQREHGGSFVEVGVFRGASLKAMAGAKRPETKLFGFDTFEGLPEAGADDPLFEKGMFKSDEAAVRERLKPYQNVTIVKGIFPDTAGILQGEKISFAHLDVDTYESTLASLKALDPLLLPGGIILSHDYSQALGVHRAFDEFLAGRKNYRLVELPVSQVMILKS